IEIAHGTADDGLRLKAVIIAVGDQAAAIAVTPEAQVRLPGALLQVARAVAKRKTVRLGQARFVRGALRPTAAQRASGTAVSPPEAITIGSARAQGEPAVEHDEVVAADTPRQRPP